VSDGPSRELVGYGRVTPRVEWPDGALVAVNLVLVYEEGSEQRVGEGDAVNDGWGEYAAAAAAPPIRDLGTETHYEYGSRAGIWRLARLVDGLHVPATVSATAVALERNREVAGWMLEGGHDLLGHGWRWLPQWDLTRDEEATQLDRAITSYADLLGVRPDAYGWNSRSFPSVHTRELLAERGFLYDSDPCNDDIPYWTRSGGQELLVVPYSKTLNDSRYLVAPGFASPRDFTDQCCGALDELLVEAAALGGRMMTVAVHARWSGQPARTSGLRAFLEHALQQQGALFMRRSDIARWWIERGPRP
jgi:peptidoglycan/xylan/chitin deacetylase (PgdA/CDA1 family)